MASSGSSPLLIAIAGIEPWFFLQSSVSITGKPTRLVHSPSFTSLGITFPKTSTHMEMQTMPLIRVIEVLLLLLLIIIYLFLILILFFVIINLCH
jgi:hypothetical protein